MSHFPNPFGIPCPGIEPGDRYLFVMCTEQANLGRTMSRAEKRALINQTHPWSLFNPYLTNSMKLHEPGASLREDSCGRTRTPIQPSWLVLPITPHRHLRRGATRPPRANAQVAGARILLWSGLHIARATRHAKIIIFLVGDFVLFSRSTLNRNVC